MANIPVTPCNDSSEVVIPQTPVIEGSYGGDGTQNRKLLISQNSLYIPKILFVGENMGAGETTYFNKAVMIFNFLGIENSHFLGNSVGFDFTHADVPGMFYPDIYINDIYLDITNTQYGFNENGKSYYYYGICFSPNKN